MAKEDIPSLYILAVYYKRRATEMLNNPWIIKDRVKITKKRLEGICRRMEIGKISKKLNEASMLHSFYSYFFCVFSFIFFAFFLATYDRFLIFIKNYDLNNLSLFLAPIFMSLMFFIVLLSIMFDAYAKWLLKMNGIIITYSDLEKRRRGKNIKIQTNLDQDRRQVEQ